MVDPQPFQQFSPLGPSGNHVISSLIRSVASPLSWLFGLQRCASLYDTLGNNLPPGPFARRALETLGLQLRVDESDTDRIPREGAAVLIANHPFGGVEGLALIALLTQLRCDVKILANPMLARFPELRPLLIPLDPFGTPRARKSNVAGLLAAHRWLEDGGLLVIFPAGEVAHYHLHCREVIDPPWQSGVARLVRRSGAPVVPVYFPGNNGFAFQAAGLLHPRLRTALLARQLLNKHGLTLQPRIGEAIPAKRLKSFVTDREMIDYLRLRTCLLGHRPTGDSRSTVTDKKRREGVEPLVAAVAPEVLAAEIGRLPDHSLLHTHGSFQVWGVRAGQAPLVLREIGRLREMTFRGHGEGTGQSLDLDGFDEHYRHLFIWQVERREVVGAYRFGASDDILGSHGLAGLYTSTLFRYRRQLFDEIGPALELGRSFVRPEYQRSFAPLLLLWQGIGSFLVQNPRYRVLFGPVSISRDYSDFARQLMTRSLTEQVSAPELARYVAPRVPVATRLPRIKGCPPRLATSFTRNIDSVHALIADIEAEQKGIPVLLRHYLNLGGKILAFNLDPDFSEVIDGLILVDLDQTDTRTLERYMGREGMATYRNHSGHVMDRPAA